MPPRSVLVLLVPIVALGALNVAAFVQNRTAPAVDPNAVSPEWQHWQALTRDERAAYVRRYLSIAQRSDAKAVWQQARQFGRLSAARQEALRTLESVLVTVITQECARGRRDLYRAPPRAAAYFVYQALVANDPQQANALARLLRSTAPS